MNLIILYHRPVDKSIYDILDSMAEKQYWLIKSEASCYSISDLKKDNETAWTGIRNYQARNFMDSMNLGDLCLFYHSNGTDSSPSGVYGIAKVSKKAHADPTQFDPKDEHYDKKATIEKPIWRCVDVKFVKELPKPVTLGDIKREDRLAEMEVRRAGSRLSVQPVSEAHFKIIEGLSN